MTTDEMILALVERHGFVLPSNIKLTNEKGWVHCTVRALSQQKAHDLCACEFARQRRGNVEMGHESWREYMFNMLDGSSAAAIKTLYEALQAQQPEGK